MSGPTEVLGGAEAGAAGLIESDGPPEAVGGWPEPPAEDADADSCLQLARSLIEAGRLAEAETLLEDADTRFPQSAWLAFYGAFIATSRRDWEEAFRRWRSVETRFPDNPLGPAGLGAALCDAGRLDAAEEVLQAAVQRFPEDYWSAFHHARVAGERGAWTEAMRRARNLVARFPDQPLAAPLLSAAVARLDALAAGQNQPDRSAGLLGYGALLPPGIGRADAVSLLARLAGISIGNPWQSSTVGSDIARIAAELGIWANADIGFADRAALSGAIETPIFATLPRRLPPPRTANFWHDSLERLPHDSVPVTAPDFKTLTIRDGYICYFLDVPVVVAADGRTIVRDYSSNYSGLVHFHPHRLRECLEQALVVDGAVVPIADDVRPPNFCHWIIDWLPRLAFLGNGERRDDLYVVTSPVTAAYQRESLRMCGFPDERIIEVPAFAAIRARELIVPSNLGYVIHPGFTAAPWVLAYLRSTLGLGALQQVRERRFGSGAKLYISRRDAAGRRLTNEDELVARLKCDGYSELTLSGLPLAQQIEAFASASRVISINGAGLVNFAFSPADGRLLEIFPKSYGMATIYLIAAGLGNPYLSYLAEQVVPAGAASFDDITLDVEDFVSRCRDFYA